VIVLDLSAGLKLHVDASNIREGTISFMHTNSQGLVGHGVPIGDDEAELVLPTLRVALFELTHPSNTVQWNGH
jgi:hypothetical protein